MNVQELIDELNKIQDKTRKILVNVPGKGTNTKTNGRYGLQLDTISIESANDVFQDGSSDIIIFPMY